MAYYVYIIYSPSQDIYYKGSTENPLQRLSAHNAGDSQYTHGKGPWQMIYLEEIPSKTEMLIREKKLKRGNKAYFEKLIASPDITPQYGLKLARKYPPYQLILQFTHSASNSQGYFL